jgi:20S proteasome subunit alpha 6
MMLIYFSLPPISTILHLHVILLLPTADLPTLINHGLSALADTLQQDKHLTIANTSIAIIGPTGEAVEKVQGSGAARRGNFRIWENEDVDGLLRAWRRSRGEPEDGPEEGDAPQVQDGQQPAAAGAAGGAPVTTGDDDVTMAE